MIGALIGAVALLLIVGCASVAQDVTLTWIKHTGPAYAMADGRGNCVIVTPMEISYAEFGRLLRQCLEMKNG